MHIPATIERRLAWEGSFNARDLGGYATASGGFTRVGRLVRTDTLERLTEAGQAAVIAYGVRTIIDLRLPVELEAGPNPFASRQNAGIAYLHHSLIDPEQRQEIANSANLSEHYRHNLNVSGARIAAILEAIADAREGAVLFHCQGGQDRTGLISAFLLDIAGVPEETIVADYTLTMECMREGVLEFLENGPGERAEREQILKFFSPHPEVMIDTLAFLHHEYGGPSAYLRQVGVSDSTIDLLRNRILGS
jgi:protein-tyrosine phosphatase